ncbi:MAG: hypothetical protein H7Y09_11625 [Chitinophagaceae bacterium]|nr:hypothetical protein [Anaerolineae bacterium]
MSTSDLPTLPAAGNQDLPLPLIVAQKWNFPLAYVEAEDGTFFAVQDWIRGLIGEGNATKISHVWTDIQRKSTLFQSADSIRSLPYLASDGKTYQRDYTTDKGLYLNAQNLRSTKARPALAAIKKYLAESGAFADQVRRDPNTIVMSGAMTPDQAMEAAIAAYRAQGKDDRWIQARLEGKIKRNRFTAALSAAVIDILTPKHYALATDDIYRGLWGRTAAYLKGELQLPPKANLRDHQPLLALHYQGIAEEAAAHKLGRQTELTWQEAREIVKIVAAMVGHQASEMSEFLEMDLATGKALLGAN